MLGPAKRGLPMPPAPLRQVPVPLNESAQSSPAHLVLHSAAMVMACTTASGSSALACRMGAPMTFSTSEGCGLLRPWRGMVVNPT